MTQDNQGIVTVSKKARSADIARAQALAATCGLRFLPRGQAKGDRVLTVERDGVRLRLGETEMTSHPGLGLVRLRRLVRETEHDPLVDLAELRPGDSVLDATFGYGQDALVLAYAVQPGGRVVALEASPLLTALALAGMPTWPEPAAEVARNIELHRADFHEYLAQAPSKSFDVVYFDPMFRSPRPAAPDFAVLRQLAEMAPLTEKDVAEALRVARRLVIVKDAWPGREAYGLGFEVIQSRRSAEIVYGWRRVDGGAR